MEPTTTPKPFVLVVTPFTKDIEDTYQHAIKPACVEAGTYCERLSEHPDEEGMLDRIYNEIAKADLIIADMTGQNANVSYEVGYAHALGKRVILVANDGADIPFDLKRRFHIINDGPISRLKEQLSERIGLYVAQPKDHKDTAGRSAQFYFRGEPVAPTKEYKARLRYIEKDVAVFLIDIAAHNPNGVGFNEVAFTPALITPAQFEDCWNPDGGFTVSSLVLPDGRRLHQYDGEVAVRPSGWQKIQFGLPRKSGKYGERHPVVLRILEGELPREIEFTVLLTDGDGDASPPKPLRPS